MAESGTAAAASAAVTAPFKGLTPIMSRQIQALIAASNGSVYLKSGYRTLDEQNALYQKAGERYGTENASKWVANPANSNHVKGSAADLGGDLSVIGQLAPQFGLVSPMSWEPWHLELASNVNHSEADSYTTPPPGSQNPTEADNSQNPGHVAASIAESLLGMTNSQGTGTAGFSNGSSDALQTVLDTAPLGEGAQGPAGPQGPGGGSASSSGGTNNTGKGNVDPHQLYTALQAAGLPPAAAAAFVSIAGRESSYNTGAFNGNHATGDQSYGLFQINLLNGGWTDFLKAHGLSNPAQDLLTEDGAVRAAAAIYQSSGLNPWGGYKGANWYDGTSLQAGVDASGGQVTTQDLEALR